VSVVFGLLGFLLAGLALQPGGVSHVPLGERSLSRDRSADESEALIPLTQEEIASLADTSRKTVNRVLQAEQERGTLQLRRGRTLVLEREAIARRAR
jgi:CRP-like cAMP-binding protein